jgi:hypothetical protein
MRDDNHDSVPCELTEAVELLRRPPVVRPEWRAELLRRAETSANARPDDSGRRLSLSIPWALAAGLVCALIGAGAVMLVRADTRTATPAVAATPSAAGSILLPVRFSLVAPNAASVSIVGDFNNWNPTTLPMRRSADGRMWEVEVRLPLGRYNYAFLVDGRLARDPGAPSTTDDGFGTPNSVLMVQGS